MEEIVFKQEEYLEENESSIKEYMELYLPNYLNNNMVTQAEF